MAITAIIRQEVLLSGDCAYCGGYPTQVDHIQPLSRGGTDDWDNLCPACRMCNMEKGDWTPEEWRAWREEEGLGWPPEGSSQMLMRIIRETAERYGMSEEEGQRRFLKSLKEKGLSGL